MFRLCFGAGGAGRALHAIAAPSDEVLQEIRQKVHEYARVALDRCMPKALPAKAGWASDRPGYKVRLQIDAAQDSLFIGLSPRGRECYGEPWG